MRALVARYEYEGCPVALSRADEYASSDKQMTSDANGWLGRLIARIHVHVNARFCFGSKHKNSYLDRFCRLDVL